MAIQRQRLSIHAEAALIEALKIIARQEGRELDLVLEEAIREFVEKKKGASSRQSVLSHFRDSVKKNRRLGELLAQ